MLLRSIRPFTSHPRVRHTVVALPKQFAEEPPEWLVEIAGQRLTLVPGGETRAHSVGAAFDALEPQCKLVLVHDAARPFVGRDVIDAVIDRADGGVCAVAAVPVSDTIKRVTKGTQRVAETIERSGLWRAQTPQGMPREMLQRAYELLGEDVGQYTDEAALIEAIGGAVELVVDDASNIKLTNPRDFEVAGMIIRR